MEGPTHEQVESLTLPKESVALWGPHTGAGSWQDLLTMERGAMLKQVFWQDLWLHGKQPEWSSLFMKNCSLFHLVKQTHVHEGLQPLGRTCIGEFHGELSPKQGTPHWNK